MIRVFLLVFCLATTVSFGQSKSFIDRPYLETNAKADTLVVPDRIYLSIMISEADTKDRSSVEKLEGKMEAALSELGIDIKKQLFLADLATDFKDYFLRKTGVIKSKAYSLVIYDALMAGKVIQRLESEKIANVNFQKSEISNIEEIKLDLRKKAVAKGLLQASALLEPLGKSGGDILHISDDNTWVRYPLQQRNAMREVAVSEQSQPIDIDFQKIRVESVVSIKMAID